MYQYLTKEAVWGQTKKRQNHKDFSLVNKTFTFMRFSQSSVENSNQQKCSQATKRLIPIILLPKNGLSKKQKFYQVLLPQLNCFKN